MAKEAHHRRSWRHRFHRNMGTLHKSSCSACRRQAYWRLLHQTRQIRGRQTLPSQRVEGRIEETEDVSFASRPQQATSKVTNPAVLPETTSKQTTGQDSAKKRKHVAEPEEPTPSKSLKEAKKPKVDEPPAKRPRPEKEAKLPKVIEASVERPQPVKKAPGEQSKPKQASAGQPTQKSQPEPARKKVSAAVSSVSKSWPANVGLPKLKGFPNPRVFCYRRSTLQNLLCVPQFLNLLTGFHPQCKKACVVCSMRQLAVACHTTGGGVSQQISQLDKTIRATGRASNPMWDSFHEQDDAALFLLYLLESIERGKGITKEDFRAIYTIKHRATWTCQNCNKVHNNDESNPHANALQVDLAGNTLAECIAAQNKETGTVITCDKCKKTAKRTRNFKITSAPQVLYIHLKRFNSDMRGRTWKNTKHIDIPETLDLSRWAADESAGPMKYKLQAAVLQSGSLRTGHYIAYVRSAKGWRDVSDDDISRADLSVLSRKKGDKPSSWSPYILTYVRDDEDDTRSASVGKTKKQAAAAPPLPN